MILASFLDTVWEFEWHHAHAINMNRSSLLIFYVLNRSGLWRHKLETCRRLRRLCRKQSNNVARHDKTPVNSTLLSRDMKRSDLMVVTFIHLKVALHGLSVWLFVCSVATYDIIFCCRPVYYKTQLFYETAWSILFWNHKNDVTSLVKFCMENTSRRRVFSVNFDWVCDVTFIIQIV